MELELKEPAVWVRLSLRSLAVLVPVPKEVTAFATDLNILRLTWPLLGGRVVNRLGDLACGLDILVKWVLEILKLDKEEVKKQRPNKAMKLWSLREREIWMNEAERREEGYFYIQVFWDCGVVTNFFFFKKRFSLFWGCYYLLYTTQTDFLFCLVQVEILCLLEEKLLGQNNYTL